VDGGALPTAWPGSCPELTTKRLRLRAPAPRDAEALLGIFVSPALERS